MATPTVGPRSIRIALLFVVLAGLPAMALSWLGWRLLQQDQRLAEQQQRDQLTNAATLLARALEDRVQEIERRLQAEPLSVAEAVPSAAVVALTRDGVQERTGRPLPFYPRVADAASPTAVFGEAERIEFRDRDPRRAAGLYRVLANTDDARVRAAALVRLARACRQSGQLDAALAAFDALGRLEATPVMGSPSELVARRERAVLFDRLGRSDAAAGERRRLAALLDTGRYAIDRETFEFFGESASPPPAPNDVGLAMASALADWWPRWTQEASGRTAARVADEPLVIVWRRSSQEEATGAVVVAPAASVVNALSGLAGTLAVAIHIEDADRGTAWGRPVPESFRVSLLARESGLPWNIHLAPSDDRWEGAMWRRRQLFAAGLFVMVIVMAVAGFAVFRAVSRELTLAHQQSDFVATVSHEFRTPLTAMAHLTELLEDGQASAARLPDYYAALGKETRRLRDLVEHVLDFGQLESGRRHYDMEVVDARVPVQHAVDGFAARAGGTRLRLAPPAAAYTVRADCDAMALAVGTLVDNALKYSPAASPVAVSIAPRGEMVGITVEDHGPGIPRDEQRQLFRKFVRGSAARASNVQGTGLGLAIADAIVRAHGGRLDVSSEVGRGSCFTVLLPRVQEGGPASAAQGRYGEVAP